MNKQVSKKMPFYVKLPLGLAFLLSLLLVVLIAFEQYSKNNVSYKPCSVIKSDLVKSGRTDFKLAANISRANNGEMYFIGLHKDAKEWGYYRLSLTENYSLNLEPISKTNNDLNNIQTESYELLHSYGDSSILKTNQNIHFVVQRTNSGVRLLNNFGYCGKNWDENADIKFVTKNIISANEQNYIIGFYDIRKFETLVPRGVAKNADALFSIDHGNQLEYRDCNRLPSLQHSKKVQFKSNIGSFSINSGDSTNISIFNIDKNKELLNIEGRNIPFNSFGSFELSPSDFIFTKQSNWLDLNEDWQAYLLRSNSYEKELIELRLNRPIKTVIDYTPVTEQENKNIWIAQNYGTLQKSLRLTFLTTEKSHQDYSSDDSVAIATINKNGIWSPLPSGRHLFISNDNQVRYSILDCH